MYKHGDHRSVVGISILRVRDILCQDHKEPQINSFMVETGRPGIIQQQSSRVSVRVVETLERRVVLAKT